MTHFDICRMCVGDNNPIYLNSDKLLWCDHLKTLVSAKHAVFIAQWENHDQCIMKLEHMMLKEAAWWTLQENMKEACKHVGQYVMDLKKGKLARDTRAQSDL